jgi:hypothetical protein
VPIQFSATNVHAITRLTSVGDIAFRDGQNCLGAKTGC